MNKELLQKHVAKFSAKMKNNPERKESDFKERNERINYYQAWSKDKIKKMTEEEFSEYISKLWAMLLWGNKSYRIKQIIDTNGFDLVKNNLANLLYGNDDIEKRWDSFLSKVKYFGPSTISEILCHTFPEKYMIWNKKADIAFEYLNVNNVPKYNYQLNGNTYKKLTSLSKDIEKLLKQNGFPKANLLTVDYFIWDELQIIQPVTIQPTLDIDPEKLDSKKAKSLHNELRDKLADIGSWLGFESQTEIKITDGSVVDTIWESSVGNMGKFVYVFEVQTKGNIDSLLINLQQALTKPGVQGVVAVSDLAQIEKIKRKISNLGAIFRKLKFWDQEEVLKVYDSLELVNTSINRLGLVPDSIYI